VAVVILPLRLLIPLLLARSVVLAWLLLPLRVLVVLRMLLPLLQLVVQPPLRVAVPLLLARSLRVARSLSPISARVPCFIMMQPRVIKKYPRPSNTEVPCQWDGILPVVWVPVWQKVPCMKMSI
jgi:hypothetical protein